jgi:hypothetical protein
METVKGSRSLGTKIIAVGRALNSQMFCSSGWNIKTVCWCHPALQLESELELQGHDQRKQMLDQTSENICFALPVWMRPAWPEVSAFGSDAKWRPIASTGHAKHGQSLSRWSTCLYLNPQGEEFLSVLEQI